MAAEAGARRRRFPVPLFEGILPIDKAGVPKEVIAGVTLAALAIPEVMGYTKIAGMRSSPASTRFSSRSPCSPSSGRRDIWS